MFKLIQDSIARHRALAIQRQEQYVGLLESANEWHPGLYAEEYKRELDKLRAL